MRYVTGDIVEIDLGVPVGSEAGFVRPAVIVSARDWLNRNPFTVFAVPLTTTKRPYPSHVEIPADASNGLPHTSYAQVELLRSISVSRVATSQGNAGPVAVSALRDIASLLLDLAP